MYYAITIMADGLITDRHESMRVITADMFVESEYYMGQEVVEIAPEDEYQGGHWLDEYVGGKLLPLIDRIIMGRAEVPPGYEMIDGELVAVEKPVEEQPESVRDKIARIDSQAEVEQKAARVMFRALAQTDVISTADALDNAGMFPVWADRVGTEAKVGEYLRHENGLCRVKQAHKIQAHYPPSIATAALYSKVAMPGEIPDWSPGSWDKGVKVKHNGKTWLSMVKNNTWEPGAPGVYDNIWKEALS